MPNPFDLPQNEAALNPGLGTSIWPGARTGKFTAAYVLKDVPLDNTYEHTILFNSQREQWNWFIGAKFYPTIEYDNPPTGSTNTVTDVKYPSFEGKMGNFAKWGGPNISYQRITSNRMRLQLIPESATDCNYLMFCNIGSAFEDSRYKQQYNKWYYAFITDIKYINNTTTEIEYEIDVMQTYMFDYHLLPCFVEREHTATDKMFDNLVEETLDLGDDYVCYHEYHKDLLEGQGPNKMNMVMLTTGKHDSSGQETLMSGSLAYNIYTPLKINGGIPMSDPKAIDAYLSLYVDKGFEDDIVSLYGAPDIFFGGASGEYNTYEDGVSLLYPENYMKDVYSPTNNKLYAYPYNFLLVSNNEGDTAKFKWENFQPVSYGSGSETPAVGFTLTGVAVPSCQAMIYPMYHRGIEKDYDSGLVMKDFPVCAWVGNAYAAWWAQNKNSVVFNTAAQAISSAARIATYPGGGFGSDFGTMNTVSNAISIVNAVGGVLAKKADLENTPPQVHGQVNTNTLKAGMDRYKFSFYHMTVKPQFLAIIDNYFTRFGYAIHKIKVPNTNVRPHYTFTKTVGCAIETNRDNDLHFSLPMWAVKRICSIYDNGITFWKDGFEIGHYELDNRPTS